MAETQEKFKDTLSREDIEKIVEMRVDDELRSGVQTIQYQINTLMTTNGQSPFVTLFLYIDENNEYVDENVRIIEEILRQRLDGIKNEQGVYVTPAFPKLIYVLDENNCLKGGKYDYVTKLAVKCSAKRMYPDYISAKKMRENYEGNVFSCMGCRSFLSPWKDENGEYKWEGRFNQGVVSINLPQIGLVAKGDEEKFWKLFDERLELCYEALMCRHKALEGVVSDVSPIHWQYGAIARLKKGETIDKYLHNGYSTLSLGYIGLYELTYLMTGESQTSGKGKEFALKVMYHMRDAAEKWKEETGLKRYAIVLLKLIMRNSDRLRMLPIRVIIQILTTLTSERKSMLLINSILKANSKIFRSAVRFLMWKYRICRITCLHLKHS